MPWVLWLVLFLLSGCAGHRPVVTRPPSASDHERLQMELARLHFENGDFELARKEYVRLMINNSSPYIQETAQYMIGESFFQQNDCAQALRYFAHYVTSFPSASRRAESDVRLSQCAERLQAQAQEWDSGRLRQMQGQIQGEMQTATAPLPGHGAATQPKVKPREVPKPPPGVAFHITWYWVEAEADHEDKARVPLLNVRGEAITQVSAAFHKRLLIEGTGRLRDGRVVNWAAPGRFMVVDSNAPFGLGAGNRPLIPLRTIAVDPQWIALDTVVYLAELDGFELPNRQRHDGCLVAGDVGSAIRGAHIDIFSPSYDMAMPILQKLPENLVLRKPAKHCLAQYDLADAYGLSQARR